MVYLTVSAVDAARVDEANEHGAAGRFDAAVETARGQRRAPARVQALTTEAYALSELGDHRGAASAFARAVRDEPNDWVLRRNLAVELLAAGDRRGAAHQMARALALNPRMDLPAGFRRKDVPGARGARSASPRSGASRRPRGRAR